MTKTRAQWGANWFSIPKTRTAPRSGTAPAVPRPNAPMCACGCGRRILPLAEQYGNLYFSRACREKHLGIGVREARSRRLWPSTRLRHW